ncbi:MAG: ATP-dependent protease [Acidobacteria bacterium]|nr:MAG: ATP-dependent protease [Acidobacteriota bacterium]
MAAPKPLTPDQLYRKCDFGKLVFETTHDLEPLEGLLGQPRAVAAVEFGIGIERDGYNIFAFGPPGTGKHTAVQQYLERKAAGDETPGDLCYVNNFEEQHRPKLLQLPTGRGGELRRAMERLVDELTTGLQSALDSEEYQTQRQVLEEQFNERQAKALAELGDEAGKQGLALLRTPAGMAFAPVQDDEILSPEEFSKLPEEDREQLEKDIDSFKEKLQKVLRQFPRWQREARERLRKLNLEVSRFAIQPLIDELREQFTGLDDVQIYLDAVEDDVLENAGRLVGQDKSPAQALMQALGGGEETDQPSLRRYRVNVLVDHHDTEGAPVVYEDNPTYQNLVGRVEHISQMGALVTDFNLIKAGALHRATGGYLLVDALKLLGLPYAYEGLKRAMQSKQIKIESIGEALSLTSTYSLEPEPVDLEGKIVLLGDSTVYYLLSAYDPEFSELFKVAADFAGQLEWSPENQALYARLIAKLVREDELRPLDREAVARVIEHSARMLEDSEKISLLMSRIFDLLREADYWAGQAERDVVTTEDVQKAIDAGIFRLDRYRERIQEEIDRGTLLLDTSGAKVGQVNGLSVYQLGDFAFGRPSRITARVRLGKGEVLDIEREVELSGPIHSKGVLILGGFLGARYAPEVPLSLSASLVFEQSYGGVDGDSASSAELYALLSAIAEVPIKQTFAVTGSVNQRGEVQAIGGANEKIEGFFDVCTARGLDGEQGVLIPAANVKHLMLREDVVEAVAQGKFNIYAVETVDQGIEILTGKSAGERDGDGEYPEDSINRLVEDRLIDLAETAQEFSGPPEKDEEEEEPKPKPETKKEGS